MGSKELLFEPAKQRHVPGKQSSEPRRRTLELQRPGSVWLILQALLPWYLLQSGRTELILKGGTNVSSSMSADYVQQVLGPLLEKVIHSKIQVAVRRRGWAGNAPQIGEVQVSIEGRFSSVRTNNLSRDLETWEAFTVEDRGDVSKIAVTIIAHPPSLRETLLSRAIEELSRAFPDVEIEITTNEDSLDTRRLYLLLVAHTTSGWRLGRDFLGTGKKLNSQREIDGMVDGAAREVVSGLKGELEEGGCVDEYLQDQLVVFQALGRGRSVVDAGGGLGTLHARTVTWVCGEMLGGLGFENEDGVACMGVGSGLGRGRDDSDGRMSELLLDDEGRKGTVRKIELMGWSNQTV